MKRTTRFIGLDVHADTIAVAVAEDGRAGEVRALGTIANRGDAIRKLIKKLGGAQGLRACYEAGPTGYVLYWQLTEIGVECEVVAPSLVPTKAGDRVKTDRRDAMKLARCYRAGDLTTVWVPDRAHEALRDLVRAREAAKKDQLRARNRLSKFLLRAGRRRPQPQTRWGTRHLAWIREQKFEHTAQQVTMDDYLNEVDHASERVRRLDQAIDDAVKHAHPTTRAIIDGLQALRGVAKVIATTLAVEIGLFSRFTSARQLMSWSGMTPSEYSTGGPGQHRRGAITKSGNAHLRRVLCEAAWSNRHSPRRRPALQKRQRQVPSHLNEIAWRAQHRLHKRYTALSGHGKPQTKVVTAVARELLGFVWAIAVRIEQDAAQQGERQPHKLAA